MSTPQLTRWQHYIIIAHVALAVLFGVIIPPWEAHDETGHFAYVNQLVTQHALPDARSNDKAFLDQSHQPPLYYLVVAGLTFWIDRSDQLNPQINVFAFDGTNRRGTRILLRSPGESFPWQGTILALHAARLVTTLLSACMLLVLAAGARLLFQDNPNAALLATAIAAFNPQVLFMAGMVNNDIMISLMGSLLIYLLVRTSLLSHPLAGSRRKHLLLAALTGLTLALCLWSKNSGLILIPLTGLALIYLARRHRWTLVELSLYGLVVYAVTFIVAAPFYLLNMLRYGQWLVDRASESPLVLAPTSLISTGLAVSLRDGWLPQIFINAFRTFWGTFGWGNVQMPDTVYTIIAILAVLGIMGCVVGWRHASAQQHDSLVLLLMAGSAMLLLPGYRAFFYQNPALLPGRYLMPALVAYSGMMAFGWVSLGQALSTSKLEWWQKLKGRLSVGRSVIQSIIPERRLHTSQVVAVAMALGVLLVPFGVIAPAYALPSIQNTPDSTPALLTFEDVAQVTSVTASTVYLSDREGMRHYAHVRLTWRVLKRATTNYAFGISILGRDSEVLGNLNIEPARGAYPSTNWNAGDTFDDEYDVLLEKPCPHLPASGRVSVSVYEFKRIDDNPGSTAMTITHQLQARDGDGRVIAPIVGRFRIDAPSEPMAVFWQPPLASFNNIALRQVSLPAEVQPGATMTLGLTYETWRSGNPAGNVFVHLFDDKGNKVAQDDHVPGGGAYPTDMWQAGECIEERFNLNVPVTATGTLTAMTGFYVPATGARFATGQRDDLAPIGQIVVR
jgi:hypothetical protein